MARWLAPEVVQTSAMDCGPASLKTLLEGFGIPVSYGRLREACQTSVDGTSIDALEDAANALGLEATQMMAPADHLLLPQASLLPALVVVLIPGGGTHFVVVWRRHGNFVQIMDPAVGRRWVSARRFLKSVFRHTQAIPADAWVEWAKTGEFRGALLYRMKLLGFDGTRLLDEALAKDGWQAVAALDAAVRMAEALAAEGAIKRGSQSRLLVPRLAAHPEGIPKIYWSLQADPQDAGQVLFSAAVLLHVRGRSEKKALPENVELKAALVEPPARPGRELLKLVLKDSRLAPGLAAGALALATAGVLFEAILFRSLFDLGRDLHVAAQRWWAAGILIILLGTMLLLELSAAGLIARIGRKLEVRLRASFLRKIPLLGDRYFQSRLTSDMAERGHSLQRLRELPNLAAGLLRPVFEMIMTVGAIAWLYPASALPAILAAIAAIGIPLLAQPGLATRDLRWRNHTGALSRFQLDALLGWTAIRAHGAEPSLLREQDFLLGAWTGAGLELQNTVAVVGGIQLLCTLGLVCWLLFTHAGAGDAGALLLLVYWALRLPTLGQDAAAVAWQYPQQRSSALRVMELLGAREENESAQTGPIDNGLAGTSVVLEDVTVLAAGHTILSEVNLVIAPGEHVGIVGPSGAGKSTLVGLLLGWHTPIAGRILVDGKPLDVEAVRRDSAWVDPQIQIWNRPLLENLKYGSDGNELEEAIAGANLRGVIGRLPDGLLSPLGEGGALVSGGEGQRVRVGRALMKRRVRMALLDEPARGLDRAARRSLVENARATWRSQTLLVVTHDVSDTMDLPRVLVVEGGRIIEDGDPRELAKNPESRYRALLDAEDAVRRSLWSSAQWRRLRIANGALAEEEPKCRVS
jgi:ABC-type bacteriocin/lantibiotic exporter with double-glycine peptidase domain